MFDPESYEYQRDESPLARMHREQAKQEAKDAAVVDRLLASIGPADNCPLFTFYEMRLWGLKHCRKRARVNNDHEADGA